MTPGTRWPPSIASRPGRLEVRTPTRLRRDAAAHAAFAALDLDAAIVAAYGLILPAPILAAPRRGCVNIHASLLPRWRGAAPIQAAIMAGDATSGVTIMQMDEGLDTGPMLARGEAPLGPRATAAWLHDRLSEMGAALIGDVLAHPPVPVPQPTEGVTYAAKLTREDGRIDWTQDAAAIDRRVRALNPWPGTFTTLEGHPFKILEAELCGGEGPPGTVLDGLAVACGAGALRLLRVQAPGRAALAAPEFLRGHPVAPGTVLGPPAEA
jgi:methionyl-tRNA formyltransferase